MQRRPEAGEQRERGLLPAIREALRPDSLAVRLFAAAAIWSVVALPAAGFVLHSMFRHQVEKEFVSL